VAGVLLRTAAVLLIVTLVLDLAGHPSVALAVTSLAVLFLSALAS
jgi:hypothetical protein